MALEITKLRKRRPWTAVRILLAVSGATLVVFPIGLGNNYALSVTGLAMFVFAILVGAANPKTAPQKKALALGARVVVNGGRYQPDDGSAAEVELFVDADSVWALDKNLAPLLVLAIPAITSVDAERSPRGWTLRVCFAEQAAEFQYEGASAEQFAHAAERALRNVMPAPPVVPQRRAASA
jgi:hypothetical protein